MIPQALQERADVLGLKVTRPKNRSSMFQVTASDGEVIYSHAQNAVAAWLDGAIWAAKVHEGIDPRNPVTELRVGQNEAIKGKVLVDEKAYEAGNANRLSLHNAIGWIRQEIEEHGPLISGEYTTPEIETEAQALVIGIRNIVSDAERLRNVIERGHSDLHDLVEKFNIQKYLKHGRIETLVNLRNHFKAVLAAHEQHKEES